MLVVRDFTAPALATPAMPASVDQPAAELGSGLLAPFSSMELGLLDELAPADFESPSSSSSLRHEEIVEPALPVALETAREPAPPAALLSDAARTPEPAPARKRARRRAYQLPASTRQKNRAAQQRFRLRQKARQEEMVAELEELRSENGQLRSRVAALEGELRLLRKGTAIAQDITSW